MPQAQYQFLLDLANTKFQPDLISCGLAAQDQPSTYDITNKVMEASVRRGRENELDPFGPGTMTLLLDNTDWRFTPDYGASPLYGYLRPGAMITARVPVPDYAGLVSWWTLDESSASTRYDRYGTNHLSVVTTGTVNAATGHVGNGARVGSTDALQVSSNSTIQAGDTDFSIACWVKLESGFTTGYIASKFNDSVGGNEWALSYASNNFKFTVYTSAGVATTVTASTFGTISAGTWYCVMAFHDSVNNVIGISVNNGTIDTSSYSAGVAAGSAAFVIGAYDGGAVSSDHFVVDGVSFWKRVLPSVSVATIIYVLDQFTDTNGTNITAHTIAPTNTIGGTWTVNSNTGLAVVDIQSNQANISTGASRVWVYMDTAVTDVTATVKVTIPTAFYGAGASLRGTANSNVWNARAYATTNIFQIEEVTGGTTTSRASTSVTVNTATQYTVVFGVVGNDFSATLNGGSALAYTSSVRNTATKHGFLGEAVNTKFDDAQLA